jgi:hypothetical protein
MANLFRAKTSSLFWADSMVVPWVPEALRDWERAFNANCLPPEIAGRNRVRCIRDPDDVAATPNRIQTELAGRRALSRGGQYLKTRAPT